MEAAKQTDRQNKRINLCAVCVWCMCEYDIKLTVVEWERAKYHVRLWWPIIINNKSHTCTERESNELYFSMIDRRAYTRATICMSAYSKWICRYVDNLSYIIGLAHTNTHKLIKRI